jgi:dihydrofolate synthase/folylpolyglutamate synthase
MERWTRRSNREVDVAIDTILQPLKRFGVRLGLEVSHQLLSTLGNPHRRVPIIHVAGSNGKGSVCAYLSAVLTEAGYRVGRYTSPHLISWCDRICINEQPISAADLEAVLHQVMDGIQPEETPPTQFEVITAAAWLYFAQQNVDIAVMEVGLGGRLDATNVCDRPLVSIITSISREHWQRLGSTLADIAAEKAGILKPGCPAVIGQLPPEAKAVIDRRIADLNCPAIYPSPAIEGDIGWATAAGIHYALPLQGAIQLHNSALAIAALLLLREQGWRLSHTAIAQGMAKTRWAGRLEWMTWNGHPLLIDGAHNSASAEVLRQFVDSLPDRVADPRLPFSIPSSTSLSVNWVMGMLVTKDHGEIFKALLRLGDRLYLTAVPGHLSAEPEMLAIAAQEVCPDLGSCQIYPDVFSAIAAATDGLDSSVPQRLTVLCGSLYLLGHFLEQVIRG